MKIKRAFALRAAAAVWLIAGALIGAELIGYQRLVTTTAVDCLPPAGYSGGGYSCYTLAHTLAWAGVLVLIAAVVGAVALYRIGRGRS